MTKFLHTKRLIIPRNGQPLWTALCPECACDHVMARCLFLYSITPEWNWGTPYYYWKCVICKAKLVQYGNDDVEPAAY